MDTITSFFIQYACLNFDGTASQAVSTTFICHTEQQHFQERCKILEAIAVLSGFSIINNRDLKAIADRSIVVDRSL